MTNDAAAAASSSMLPSISQPPFFEKQHTLASSAVGRRSTTTTTKLGGGGGAAKPPDNDNDNNVATIFLYLIRHGEAEHNILEKAAKKQALKECLEEGLTENDPLTISRVEKARKDVLNNESLRDACLSPAGRQQAIEARYKLEQILSSNSTATGEKLPTPNYVVVSPLTRTLETCDLIFPNNHNSIHVRDELAERHTGKPPDTRTSDVSSLLRRHPEFLRYSMTRIINENDGNVHAYLQDDFQLMEEKEKAEEEEEVKEEEEAVEVVEEDEEDDVQKKEMAGGGEVGVKKKAHHQYEYFHMLPCYHQIKFFMEQAATSRAKVAAGTTTTTTTDRRDNRSSNDDDGDIVASTSPTTTTTKMGVFTQDPVLEEKYARQGYEFHEEDKIALRRRTHKCMNLLAESHEKSIACVTHKGYLRELERGFFQNEDATEFDNCEIRIYKLTIDMDEQRVIQADPVPVP